MKNYLFIAFATIIIGCSTKKSNVERKYEILDSLKVVYANKPIHLTFTNNEAGTKPITTQYAYIDKAKSDLAFDLSKYSDYKLSYDEAIPFIPTQNHPTPENRDMVKIEAYGKINNSTLDIGFVSYKYISEFEEVSYYDK